MKIEQSFLYNSSISQFIKQSNTIQNHSYSHSIHQINNIRIPSVENLTIFFFKNQHTKETIIQYRDRIPHRRSRGFSKHKTFNNKLPLPLKRELQAKSSNVKILELSCAYTSHCQTKSNRRVLCAESKTTQQILI